MTTVGDEVIAKCKEEKGRRMKGEASGINARKGREVKPRAGRRRKRKRGAGVGVENVNGHRSKQEQPKVRLELPLTARRKDTARRTHQSSTVPYGKSSGQLEGGESPGASYLAKYLEVPTYLPLLPTF